MANGIDWFRWHHGSVNDPKFGLVAKKAGARVGDVITVWALVLELASANTERGRVDEIDHETTDFLLGAEDGTTSRILEAMEGRGLLAGGRVVRWDSRQPKREREDNTAAERKRAQRQRDSAKDGETTTVTASHDMSHQVTPREEKRREEEKREEQPQRAEATHVPESEPPRRRAADAPASRLPADWTPSPDDIAFCKTERPDLDATATGARFHDYWVAQPGAKGKKTDWPATWRNWVRNEKPGQQARAGPGGASTQLTKAGQATARNIDAWLEKKMQEKNHG
jgi:hypothetical protein